MCKVDWKGVTGVRKPAKEVGGDKALLTVWTFGCMRGRSKLNHLGVWDEGKGRELEEDWLAWVPRLMALLSLKWGPGGGVGSGRMSSS